MVGALQSDSPRIRHDLFDLRVYLSLSPSLYTRVVYITVLHIGSRPGYVYDLYSAPPPAVPTPTHGLDSSSIYDESRNICGVFVLRERHVLSPFINSLSSFSQSFDRRRTVFLFSLLRSS